MTVPASAPTSPIRLPEPARAYDYHNEAQTRRIIQNALSAGTLGVNITGNAGSATDAGTAGSVAWADVTGKPTTLAGYGITDAYTKAATDILLAAILSDAEDYTDAEIASALAAFTGTANIATVGTITSGVWQGSSISTTYTDAKLKTLTGTTNRITVAGTSTDPTVDISTSYVGQTSITTLGTIATGTWSASTIAVNKGGTGLASYTTGDVLYASGTTTLAKLALGTSGYVLTAGASAPQWSATSTLAVPAGSLTGTTLASNVVTSSLTTIGTLIAGAVPASLVTAGTFGAGAYTFPSTLTVTGLASFNGTGTNSVVITNNAATSTTLYANPIFKILSGASGADTSIQFSDAVTANGFISWKSSNFYVSPSGGTTVITANNSLVTVATPLAITGALTGVTTLTASGSITIGTLSSIIWSGNTSLTADGSSRLVTGNGLIVTGNFQNSTGSFQVTNSTGATIAGTINGQTVSSAANFTGTLNVAGTSTFVSAVTLNAGLTVGNAGTNDKFLVQGQAAGSGPILFALNNSGAAYAPLTVDASTFSFRPSGTLQLGISGTGVTVAGTLSVTGAITGPSLDTGAASDLLLKRNGTTQLTLGSSAATFVGSITTGAPSGGTAKPWKLGNRVSYGIGVPTLDTFYAEVEIDGTARKMALLA